MCRYSFMLHPKIYVPCPNPSKILIILHAICLISLMPCANSCLICCIWYVLYSNSQSMCPDSFMLCPFAYATYLYEWMLTDHIKNSLCVRNTFTNGTPYHYFCTSSKDMMTVWFQLPVIIHCQFEINFYLFRLLCNFLVKWKFYLAYVKPGMELTHF